MTKFPDPREVAMSDVLRAGGPVTLTEIAIARAYGLAVLRWTHEASDHDICLAIRELEGQDENRS